MFEPWLRAVSSVEYIAEYCSFFVGNGERIQIEQTGISESDDYYALSVLRLPLLRIKDSVLNGVAEVVSQSAHYLMERKYPVFSLRA